MSDEVLSREEVEVFAKSSWIAPHTRTLVCQLLRCMDERDAAIRRCDNWRDDYKALAAAIVGSTGLSAMEVATQARMYRPRAEAAEAENARLWEAEKELSDAYLRIRAKLNAYDTKPGDTDRFDVTEAALDAVLAENARLREALFWCSGSDDFQEGGTAREGWLKLCAPLLKGDDHE